MPRARKEVEVAEAEKAAPVAPKAQAADPFEDQPHWSPQKRARAELYRRYAAQNPAKWAHKRESRLKALEAME